MDNLWMTKRKLIFALIGTSLIAVMALAQRPGGRGGGGQHKKPTMDLPPVYSDNIPKADKDLSGKFTFTRIRFDLPGVYAGYNISTRLGDGGPPWSHDYPVAGRHFMKIVTELSKTDVTLDVNEPIYRFGDEELHKFPFVYLCEVGFMSLNDQEIAGMREYILRGGFVCVDDFREDWALANLMQHVKRAFPEQEYELKKLDISHPIFNCFFSIKTLALPSLYGGAYRGQQNAAPEFWGLEDPTTKRLLMVVNYNYDISDFWQFSDNPFSPIEETNEAYKFGVNYVMYALTH
jgi:hypothetical protein